MRTLVCVLGLSLAPGLVAAEPPSLTAPATTPATRPAMGAAPDSLPVGDVIRIGHRSGETIVGALTALTPSSLTLSVRTAVGPPATYESQTFRRDDITDTWIRAESAVPSGALATLGAVLFGGTTYMFVESFDQLYGTNDNAAPAVAIMSTLGGVLGYATSALINGLAGGWDPVELDATLSDAPDGPSVGVRPSRTRTIRSRAVHVQSGASFNLDHPTGSTSGLGFRGAVLFRRGSHVMLGAEGGWEWVGDNERVWTAGLAVRRTENPVYAQLGVGVAGWKYDRDTYAEFDPFGSNPATRVVPAVDVAIGLAPRRDRGRSPALEARVQRGLTSHDGRNFTRFGLMFGWLSP